MKTSEKPDFISHAPALSPFRRDQKLVDIDPVDVNSIPSTGSKFSRLFCYRNIENYDTLKMSEYISNLVNKNSNIHENSNIPSGYTYFGQFVAHELSSMKVQNEDKGGMVYNRRKCRLNLDTVFDFPEFCDYSAITNNHPEYTHAPVGNTTQHDCPCDLPRKNLGRPSLADTRNDDVLPLAQIHTIFLKLYNRLSEPDSVLINKSLGVTAKERTILIFQCMVWEDFLKTMVQDVGLLDFVKNKGPTLIRKGAGDFELPVEFPSAFMRFGHSMVRSMYTPWSSTQVPATPANFWSNTYNSSLYLHPDGKPENGQFNGVPRKWACEWDRFFCADQHNPPEQLFFAQKIDAAVNAEFGRIRLEALPSGENSNLLMRSLPYRTIKRGYDLGNDHAQSAIAFTNKKIAGSGLGNIPILSRDQLIGLPGNYHGLRVLEDVYPRIFKETPLWLYILRESRVMSSVGRPGRLGPFASLIIVETIYNAIISCPINIFQFKQQNLFEGFERSKSKIWDTIQYIEQ